jgi:23S rRNA (cytosine1962-C5)-methyltransferase
VRWECADVFDRLTELVRAGERFDVVILDPPKFAHRRQTVPEALRGYHRLYRLALRLLVPEGLLVCCCCTGVILQEELEQLLLETAVAARRDVHILERRGPAPDHPIAMTCPETAYLKCLICRVL